MSLETKTFAVGGPMLIHPRRHQDERGFFSETYNFSSFSAAGIADTFVQDNHSLSRVPGTVRGLHMQAPPHAQTKLVRVVRGSILDVAVDVRTGSPTYGQWVAAEISAEAWQQIYLPVGFVHGFCTLEPDTEVIYKVNSLYAPAAEGGIRWNDPALGIPWPDFAGAVLSPKDEQLPLLADFVSPFTYEDKTS